MFTDHSRRQLNMSSDESYATKDKHIPVQDDDEVVEDGIDETTADSDAQLGTSKIRPSMC